MADTTRDQTFNDSLPGGDTTKVDQYDKAHGTYKDGVNEVPLEQRLPFPQLPKAPDPSPFVLR